MNEILAMLFFAYYSCNVPDEKDSQYYTLLDPEYRVADIYIMFTRVLDLGVKELFGTITDVSSLKSK